MIVACPDCGVEQDLPPRPLHGAARCFRCDARLLRSPGPGLGPGLAVAVAALGLLVAAAALPLVTATIRGETRSAYLFATVAELGREGWPLLALMFLLFDLPPSFSPQCMRVQGRPLPAATSDGRAARIGELWAAIPNRAAAPGRGLDIA